MTLGTALPGQVARIRALLAEPDLPESTREAALRWWEGVERGDEHLTVDLALKAIARLGGAIADARREHG